MKKNTLLFLLLLALLMPATVSAHDFEVDGIYYNINGTEATVTYRGTYYYSESNEYSGDIIIPATVTYNGTTYSVTSIGNRAFSGCRSLTSIDIPNSVTSISDETFSDCNSLTSIEIPNSVTSIGNRVLSGCRSLISIYVESDNPKYDSRFNCNAIIETASNTLISGCKNTIIPNSVTTIGDCAFNDCSGLTSIVIPNSVTSIGSYAFDRCFSLTSITIPNSVTSIGDGAFNDCISLTSITIGNSVTSIGDYAFSYCFSLTSIDIPNSVTSIGDWAFTWCESLTSVTIPNSVTSIGQDAFFNCYNLTEIYSLAMTPPSIALSSTFYGCMGATLYVPDIVVERYQSADYWKDFPNIVGIPYTFEIDGTNYHATTLSTANVMANNDEASLYTGDVVIPDSVTYVGQTFAVTGIESNAFDDCYELTSVVIPNSVETIGEQAFQGCTGLTSVTIGSGVTAIGSKAFNYCNALTTVKCIGSVPPVMAGSDCFSVAAYNRATLYVPRNSEATYAASDYWYKFAHVEGWGSAGQGDVDGDGLMNIKDVTILIDVLVGSDVNTFYFESADLNKNGRIDIGDVTSLIDSILNNK